MNRSQFVSKYKSLVVELSKALGLFPEIVFAQAFIESSDSSGRFGEGYNAVHGNNYFGIRPGSNWPGEVLSNPDVKTESKIFRKYSSVEDSIKDYFSFLAKNKRYKTAGVFTASNVEEQAKALQRAGYGGASQTYAALILKVAESAGKLLGRVKQVAGDYGGYVLGAVVIGGIIYYSTK